LFRGFSSSSFFKDASSARFVVCDTKTHPFPADAAAVSVNDTP